MSDEGTLSPPAIGWEAVGLQQAKSEQFRGDSTMANGNICIFYGDGDWHTGVALSYTAGQYFPFMTHMVYWIWTGDHWFGRTVLGNYCETFQEAYEDYHNRLSQVPQVPSRVV